MLAVDPTTALAGGGIVGMFAIAVGLVVTLVRIMLKQVDASMDREQVLAQRVDSAQADADRARQEARQALREHEECRDQLVEVQQILSANGLQWPGR